MEQYLSREARLLVNDMRELEKITDETAEEALQMVDENRPSEALDLISEHFS